VEVLNGRLSGVLLAYAQSGSNPTTTIAGTCIVARDGSVQTGVPSDSINPPITAGQSITCRFPATSALASGTQYTYVIYAIDATSGKTVQIAKGVVTVGIS
jgi:hypothetical protein